MTTWDEHLINLAFETAKKSKDPNTKVGCVIVGEDKQLYAVVDRNLHTPGNWRAILTLKLKNLNTGAVTISRFKPEDKVEQAYLDNRGMTYSYQDGEDFVFTDAETFETVNLHKDWVGDQILYLKENDNCNVVFFDGKPISLELPASVHLKVTDTEPALKGARCRLRGMPIITMRPVSRLMLATEMLSGRSPHRFLPASPPSSSTLITP